MLSLFSFFLVPLFLAPFCPPCPGTDCASLSAAGELQGSAVASSLDIDDRCIDPELRNVSAAFPSLVEFCGAFLGGGTCVFCGHSGRYIPAVEDLESKAPDLMENLRALFAENPPSTADGMDVVPSGDSCVMPSADGELELEQEEEQEEQGPLMVAALLREKLALKELRLHCCTNCRGADKSLERLALVLGSSRHHPLLSLHADILAPCVRPVVALLIAELLLEGQPGRSSSNARMAVNCALEALRHGQRRFWRSDDWKFKSFGRNRVSRAFPATTLSAPPGSGWPLTFVSLLFPPTKDEAHVLCCTIVAANAVRQEREQQVSTVARQLADSCRRSVPGPNSARRRSVASELSERIRSFTGRVGSDDAPDALDAMEGSGDRSDAVFSSLAPCAEEADCFALTFFELLAGDTLPEMPCAEEPQVPEILLEHILHPDGMIRAADGGQLLADIINTGAWTVRVSGLSTPLMFFLVDA